MEEATNDYRSRDKITFGSGKRLNCIRVASVDIPRRFKHANLEMSGGSA